MSAHDEAHDFYRTRKFKSDSLEEEEMLRSRFFLRLTLNKLLATYTVGREISELPPLLEEVIEKHEIYQDKLAKNEQIPEISPLAIGDWRLPYQYEECVQVIGLCILLHRTELLKRFVVLVDNAG
ncbi:hypothetical protein [Pseudomonas sp. RL_35y_Pfl2_P42]|uniref:hypothetical protein n=1 Tax=Pseudomonas sp. RL_35y_Pfl2_P42 TaxID=3088710 RepID=UPI0030D8EBA6